ncbi:hypothetical protein Agub_g5855, partial [Astrephomene gubernaculifera]
MLSSIVPYAAKLLNVILAPPSASASSPLPFSFVLRGACIKALKLLLAVWLTALLLSALQSLLGTLPLAIAVVAAVQWHLQLQRRTAPCNHLRPGPPHRSAAQQPLHPLPPALHRALLRAASSLTYRLAQLSSLCQHCYSSCFPHHGATATGAGASAAAASRAAGAGATAAAGASAGRSSAGWQSWLQRLIPGGPGGPGWLRAPLVVRLLSWTPPGPRDQLLQGQVQRQQPQQQQRKHARG